MQSKVKSVEGVDEWVRQMRDSSKRIGYTCGAFDILHAGHVDYLSRARNLCDVLLVAVNSDESIRSYKSPLRPLNPQDHRTAVVAALGCVDAVTVLHESRPASHLERWRPDLYIKGGDYKSAGLRSAGIVENYGGKVIVIPANVETSTSMIIDKALALASHEKPEPLAATRGIIFLDRDGTIIRNVPFLHDPEQVQLLPGVGHGMAELQRLGFRLVLVTNQQGIGLGYYSLDEFIAVNQALFRQLRPFGVTISRVLFCPHSLADGCACRKPGCLLIETALRYYKANRSTCVMIGDQPSDMAAAAAAGCAGVLIGGPLPGLGYVHCVDTFGGAVEWIRERVPC